MAPTARTAGAMELRLGVEISSGAGHGLRRAAARRRQIWYPRWSCVSVALGLPCRACGFPWRVTLARGPRSSDHQARGVRTRRRRSRAPQAAVLARRQPGGCGRTRSRSVQRGAATSIGSWSGSSTPGDRQGDRIATAAPAPVGFALDGPPAGTLRPMGRHG